MSNANAFLSLYNKTDHHLKEKYNLDRMMSFSRTLDEVAVYSAVVRKYRQTLKQFGQLRNAIVHEYRDGEIIAEPNDRALEEFQKIYEKISRPKRALDIVRTNLIRLNKEDTVGKAIDVMSHKGFSRLPVIGGDGFIGMFSSAHLLEVIVKSEERDLNAIRNFRMDEVLTYADRNKQVQFISKSASVHDAIEVFETYALKDHKLDAILITETGARHQMPLGIITDNDVPALLSEI